MKVNCVSYSKLHIAALTIVFALVEHFLMRSELYRFVLVTDKRRNSLSQSWFDFILNSVQALFNFRYICSSSNFPYHSPSSKHSLMMLTCISNRVSAMPGNSIVLIEGRARTQWEIRSENKIKPVGKLRNKNAFSLEIQKHEQRRTLHC